MSLFICQNGLRFSCLSVRYCQGCTVFLRLLLTSWHYSGFGTKLSPFFGFAKSSQIQNHFSLKPNAQIRCSGGCATFFYVKLFSSSATLSGVKSNFVANLFKVLLSLSVISPSFKNSLYSSIYSFSFSEYVVDAKN